MVRVDERNSCNWRERQHNGMEEGEATRLATTKDPATIAVPRRRSTI